MNTITKWLITGFLLQTALSAQSQPEVPLAGQSGDLKIVAVYRDGGTLAPQGDVIIVSDGGDNAPIRRNAKNGDTVTLPYGNYQISFEGKWARAAKRSITIGQPSMLAILPVEGMGIDTEIVQVSISVRVDKAAACKEGQMLWLKLIPVFGPDTYEQSIGKLGHALFDNLPPGKYLLMAMEGDVVRGVQEVNTPKKITVVETKLKPCNTAK